MAKISITELLKLTENPSDFFAKLIDIHRSEINSEDKTLPKILIEASNEHHLDLLAVASSAIENRSDFWSIQHILKDVIPDLSIKIETTLTYIKITYERMQRDLLAGIQYTPFEKLAERQPETAKKLLIEVLKIDEGYVSGYISSLYVGLSKQNLEQIYMELTSIDASDSILNLQAKIHALGKLDYAETPDLVEETISLIDGIAKKELVETYGAIIQTLGLLLKYSNDPISRLSSFSDKEDPDINYYISCVLLSVQKDQGNNDWFKELLLKLSITKCNHKGTIGNIDCILHTDLRKNKNQSIVGSFLYAWIQDSDYESESISIDELYNSTIPEIANLAGFLSKTITSYFNEDKHVYHKAAQQIIAYMRVRKIVSLELDENLVKQYNNDDLLFICRKILAYVIESETLCSLVYSILDVRFNEENARNLASSIFVNHIGKAYLSSTIDFLKTKLLSIDGNQEKIKFVNKMISKLKEIQDSHSSLPKLNELRIPKKYTRHIAIEEQRNINKVMEEANEKSIFRQIAKTVNLKYGIGWFSKETGSYSESRPLSAMSEYIELPWTELTQPVSAAMERAGFRLAKRGD